jgi:putative ABC transport system permease protein
MKGDIMFKNYIKTAIRNLIRNRVYSIINIVGLAIGIACAAMILMWVNDEQNFDSFHQNKDQIYRILLQRKGTDDIMAVTPGLLAEAIKNEIPEVKYATRVIQNHRNPYKYKGKAFYEDKSYCVDPDFFKIFTFPILQGNSANPLDQPNDIIITEEIAWRYFGEENPIGKKLNWNNWSDYQVCAVMENMPANSTLQIQLIESHVLPERFWKGGYNWTNFVHEIYILVEQNSSVLAVEKKIEAILNQNSKVADRYYYVHLQPLNDIHLNADVIYSSALVGNRKYVNIFSLIALGILLIACINFINISTANSMSRAKEVGIRKVIGAQRSKLIFQFIGEFAILAFIAALLAVLTLEFALPYFNQFTGKVLSLDIHFFIFFLVIILLTALFAGSYPAFCLSAFSPTVAFKSKMGHTKKRISLRSVLVIFQFSISILLFICTFIVKEQLAYIQNKKLGFDKDNILYIPAKGQLAEKYESVKSRLLQYPGIIGVTMQESVPTTTIEGSWVHWQGQTKQDLVVRNTKVTPDYFSTMNIDLKEGRYFSEEFATDKDAAFILNEAAVDYLEFESPIGKEIRTGGRSGEIVGVVKNAHFKSLHHKIEPLIFMELNDYKSIDLFGVVLVKFSSNNIAQLLAAIKNIWREYNPNLPFEYHFLDQTIDQQYGFERRLSCIFTWFSLLAIFISCLGLFGLAAFVATSRTKEIGIRKVLGSTVSSIVALLSQSFTAWVLIANLIAWPIAWYAMNKWLQNFAYRINLTVWPFISAGFAALAIALLTVSWQAIRAATANPVEALRYE